MKENEVNELIGIFGYSFRGEDGVLSTSNSNTPSKSNNGKELILPSHVANKPLKVLSGSIFSGNNIEKLTLSEGLEIIGDNTFSDNKLVTLVLPRTVKEIGYYSFAYNPLTTVYVPPSVKRMGDTTFAETNYPLTMVCVEGTYAHEYALEGGYVDIIKAVSEEEFNTLVEKHQMGDY